MLFFHIFTSIVPLLAAPLQVWKAVRRNPIESHRWLGRATLSCGLITSVPVLYLATGIADNGLLENTIVLGAGLLWATSAACAWYFARRKIISRHGSGRLGRALHVLHPRDPRLLAHRGRPSLAGARPAQVDGR